MKSREVRKCVAKSTMLPRMEKHSFNASVIDRDIEAKNFFSTNNCKSVKETKED